MLQKAHGKAFFWPKFNPFWPHLSGVWGRENCAVHPPNQDKDASKSPKNGNHFEPTLTDLGGLWTILTNFGTFGSNFEQYWVILVQFWCILEDFGPFWKDFGPIWDPNSHFNFAKCPEMAYNMA